MTTLNVEISDELYQRFINAAAEWRGKQKNHPDRRQTHVAARSEIAILALTEWLDKHKNND